MIDGAVLYGMRRGDPAVPQALVRWRTVDAELDSGGRTLPVHIEGRSELADDAGRGQQAAHSPGQKAWRVKDVRITAMKPDEAAALRSPASPQPQVQARPQEEQTRTTH
ncbi:hypothetical protein HH212_21835 [Massilia forsythiae]|uniref:Uncharacterized protein n=1 Tax=Massilia forsythiae TaxID=2728020 RepID=A0A7Z2ZU66_9BURK|nr:hypothetical protein [Massilia forsythiae]QJE02336.1 hypothetical protein HH212_21835 [Massilia forsythiae]